jgi:hypothetical protein
MGLLRKAFYTGMTLACSAYFALASPNTTNASESFEQRQKTSRIENIVRSSPQAPEIEWEKTYDISSANCIQKTQDNGYIIVGEGRGDSSQDSLLMKINSRGNILWKKIFGFSRGANDWGSSVKQTRDNGFIVSGSVIVGPGNYNALLFKTDSRGNLQWSKNFGGRSTEYGESVQQTSDRGFATAGFTGSYGNGSYDFYLIKTDSRGNLEWQKTFGGDKDDRAYSMQTRDEGLIVAGFTKSFGNGYSDVYLVKTDFKGELQWQKTFGGKGSEIGFSIEKTLDGGFMVGGNFWLGNPISDGFYLIKTDSRGNLQWEKRINSNRFDRLSSVKQTFDKGYILMGTTHEENHPHDIYLIKTDSGGNLEWEKIIKKEDHSSASSILQTSDEGYIFTGSYRDANFGSPRNIRTITKLKGQGPSGETQLELPENPTPNPSKLENLVVVTHGWSPNPFITWPEKLTENISGKIDSSKWNTFTHNWKLGALKLTPDKTIPNAKVQGQWLGQKITDAGYKHVHLIGHSAGAWLINEAAKKIRKRGDATVHLTFLDPYARLFEEDQLAKTEYSDWAENYFSEDITSFLTNALPNTHNIDISEIDKSFFDSHSFAHEWYDQTVVSPTQTIGAETHGFIRSLEGGGQEKWNKSLELKRGNKSISLKRKSLDHYNLSENINFTSTGGSIYNTDEGIIMETLSTTSPTLRGESTTQTLPEIAQTVWFNTQLQPGESNSINFNHQFNGQGYLQVYLNDNLIHLADQRTSSQTLENSSDIYIGDYLTSQGLPNTLSFRLDNLTTQSSEVFISNPQLLNLSFPKTTATDWTLY